MSLIHHTFAPHVTPQTVLQTLRHLLTPWSWRSSASATALTRALENAYGMRAALFGTGREALLALLQALELQHGDEVIVQGYTCVVVPNAIHAAGCIVVFADTDPDTLNLTPTTVAACITPRTRAVICQHTFGIPADTASLSTLCHEHGIMLIEDCAHVLPDVLGPRAILQYGDAAILSFGRDKAISGISGGAVLLRDDPAAHDPNGHHADVLRSLAKRAQHLPRRRVLQLLLYPLLYAAARPLYRAGIGKLLLWCAARLRMLPRIVTAEEKLGHQSHRLHRIPSPCAALALREFSTLGAINDHRRALTHLYRDLCDEQDIAFPASLPIGMPSLRDELPLQKFPLLLSDATRVRAALKRRGIVLDDGWAQCVVCPASANRAGAGYRAGSCPVAEHIGATILSLPTHPTMTLPQAKTLMRELTRVLDAPDLLRSAP